MIRWTVWLFLLSLSVTAGAQGVYTWVDENGVTHFGDAPRSRDAERVEVKVTPSSSTPPAYSQPAPEGVGQGFSTQPAQPEIIMYGAAWCGVCKRARRFFRANRIHYTEYDIDTSAKGKRDYRRMNGSGVPIFLVDGQRVNGFSAARFESILGR